MHATLWSEPGSARGAAPPPVSLPPYLGTPALPTSPSDHSWASNGAASSAELRDSCNGDAVLVTPTTASSLTRSRGADRKPSSEPTFAIISWGRTFSVPDSTILVDDVPHSNIIIDPGFRFQDVNVSMVVVLGAMAVFGIHRLYPWVYNGSLNRSSSLSDCFCGSCFQCAAIAFHNILQTVEATHFQLGKEEEIDNKWKLR